MERVALLSEERAGDGGGLRLPRAPRVPVSARTRRERRRADGLARTRRIEEALRAEGGNISRAAARLGLPRNTLRYRMERHGLCRMRCRGSSAGGRVLHRPPSPPAAPVDGSGRASRCSCRLRCSTPTARRRARAHAGARDRAQGARLRRADHRAGRVVRQGGVRSRARRGAPPATRRTPLRRARAAGASPIAGASSADRASHRRDARRAARTIASSSTPTRAGRADVLDEMLADARPASRSWRRRGTKPFLERRFDVEPLAAAPDRRPASGAWWVSSTPIATRRRSCRARARLALLEDLLAQVEEGEGRRCSSPAIRASARRACCTSSAGGRDRAAWLQGSAVSFGSVAAVSSADRSAEARVLDSGRRLRRGDRRSDRPRDRGIRRGVPAVLRVSCDRSIDRGDAVAGIARPEAASRRHLRSDRPIPPRRPRPSRSSSCSRTCTGWIRRPGVPGDDGREPGVRPAFSCARRTGRIHAAVRENAFGTQLTLSRVSRADSQHDRLLARRCLARCRATCSNSLTTRRRAIRSSSRRSCDRCRSADCSSGAGDEVGLVRRLEGSIVPDSVEDVLLGRLERLDPASRDVLAWRP